MSKEVVLDIETAQPIGAPDFSDLSISVIGVYFYETNEYRCFEEHEFSELWPRLEHSDRIIGFNSKWFDVPVMNKYYPGDLLKIPHLDILEHIQAALGHRLKLDAVAEASIGAKKSGHGLQAVEWWKNGEKEKVKKYCLDDVRVTKDVYEYGLKYGALAYHVGEERRGIPVDFTKREEKSAINLTMPF